MAKSRFSLSCIVFLIPGAFSAGEGGSSRFISPQEYFKDYREYFTEKGCRVKQAVFAPDATIEERSLMLKDQLVRFAGSDRAWLIAHSQGGLDARFALNRLGIAQWTRGLATIGTPHQGSTVADWALRQREGQTWIYWTLRLFGYDLRALRFLGEFTHAFMERHAPAFDEVPDVSYGAARGVCQTQCHWGLSRLAWWTGLGPGDGLVDAESQKFGEDLGQYNLDHLSEVGTDSAKRGERQRLLERLAQFAGIH